MSPRAEPKRVLLTGAAGFVGSTLALELLRSDPSLVVIGIDNLSRPGSETNVPRLRAAGVAFFQGDIRNVSDLKQIPAVDWVIDCAANPSVLGGVDGKSSSFEVMDHNLIGTLQILEYCKQHQAGFILLSTSRVYSIKALGGLPLVERDGAFRCCGGEEGVEAGVSDRGIKESFSTAAPLSYYGMSKLCSENLALEYGATGGFPVWINRCGVLAGAGQFGRADQGIFSYWINRWLRKKSLSYVGFGGKGLQVRDVLHPKDLVSLLEEQMRNPDRPVERMQNVAGGLANSMSLQQLSDWCEKRFGAHEVTADLPSRPFDLPWVVLDSTRAKEQWGWQARIGLESILEEIAVHAEGHPQWLELSGG
jgi:CDP-paratose 2-epimerase